MSVTVQSVRINQSSVERWRSPSGGLGQSLQRLADRIETAQRRLAPVRTGALRASIRSGPIGRWARGLEVRVGANPGSRRVGYAWFNDQGTRPHPIRPRRPGGLLVFYWPKVGRVVFLRSVRHPGTKPERWATRGLMQGLATWRG